MKIPVRSVALFTMLLGAVTSACDAAGQSVGATDGFAALRTGAYEDAVRLLRPLAQDGDRAALNALVTALRETGQYPEAEAAARTGLDQGVFGAAALLGSALLDQGLVDEARPVLEAGANQTGLPGAEARLQLGILEYQYGDRDRAYQLFDSFIDYYNDNDRLSYNGLTAVGQAMVYLSRWSSGLAHDALKALDEATAVGGADHGSVLAVGNLFLERYDAAQAAQSFRAIMAVNPQHPDALYGLAMVANLEGSGDSRALAEQSLEVNPNHVGARTLLARVQLMDGNREGALEEADRALSVNPADLEAMGTKAAILYVTKDESEYASIRSQIEGLSPTPSRAHEVLAEISADHRKYQDALAFAREAASRDSIAWTGVGLMGINQVRLGDVEAGRLNLEKAFAGDPFNPWFKNTLDLVDTFSDYQTVETEHFRFILHNSEAELLSPYIGPVAERAYAEMSQRYGYEPPEPIRVEVYPRHADFSVRTVGLVGMGALGVSFGPALAMDSPSARNKGEFNWASTLWHEIAHSFHLGVTEHEVPRWFSEGLAVHEQRKGDPTWGHQASPGFIRALAEGELRPVSELDRGFSHPRRPSEVVESYYLASLVFEVIERDHGFPAIVEMLRSYKEGASNAAAFTQALGVSLDDFDKDFDDFLKDRFAAAIRSVGEDAGAAGPPRDLAAARDAVARNPGGFAQRMSLGAALFADGQLDDASTHFETALELFPQYGGPDGPHWYLGQIREEQGLEVEAAEQYRQLLALNESHYDGRKALAQVLITLGDRTQAAEALHDVAYIHPFEIEDHEQVAELFESEGNAGRGVAAREAVLALDPVDLAAAHYRLANAHYMAGNRAEARSAVLRSLEIAPNYEEALELLLQLRSEGGDR
ncbi:MAG: tetratricopeptide repeat protein [Longimicrobiales bacterium]